MNLKKTFNYFNPKKNGTAYFAVNKNNLKEVKKSFESISANSDIRNTGITQLDCFVKNNILVPIDYTKIRKADIEIDDTLIRIDMFRFENDFFREG